MRLKRIKFKIGNINKEGLSKLNQIFDPKLKTYEGFTFNEDTNLVMDNRNRGIWIITHLSSGLRITSTTNKQNAKQMMLDFINSKYDFTQNSKDLINELGITGSKLKSVTNVPFYY